MSGRWLALAALILLAACQAGRGPGALRPSATAVDRAHQEILARYGGTFADPAVEAYVATVGRRVLAETTLEPGSVRFVVIDTDAVNAYAVPGATIYLTRGLLAWLNSEAELAGVIAHELAHLTEHHAEATEALRQAEAGAGARGLASGDGAEARLREYSRNHELEADQRGLDYLVAAGYPGSAMRTSQLQFDATEALARLERGVAGPLVPAPDAMASHPSSEERIAALIALPTFAAPGDAGRDRYLDAIDGIPYGPNADDWQTDGDRMVQPAVGLAFTRPEGFRLVASAGVVSGAGPGECALIIDFVPRERQKAPADYLTQEFGRLAIAESTQRMIGGFPAAVIGGSRVHDGRTWSSMVAAVGVRDDVLMRVLAVGSEDSGAAMRAGFDTVLATMGPPGTIAAQPPRALVVHTVAPDEDVAALAADMEGVASGHAEALLRALNALGPDDALTPGQRIKLVE